MSARLDRDWSDLPELRQRLTAAAHQAQRQYDLPAELARWRDRQSDERRFVVRQRSLVMSAAAILVVLLSGFTLLARHSDLGVVNTPVAPVPSGSAALPAGIWRASVVYAHELGGSKYPGYVYLIVHNDGTGSLQIPFGFGDQPIAFSYHSVGDVVRLEADPALCPARLELALTTTQTAPGRLRVDAAQGGPCYVPEALAGSLVHATFERQPDS